MKIMTTLVLGGCVLGLAVCALALAVFVWAGETSEHHEESYERSYQIQTGVPPTTTTTLQPMRYEHHEESSDSETIEHRH